MPVIGLEPSCVAVFRDELRNLFPHDQDALRLSKQTFLLSEFLAERAPETLPKLERKAIVQGHCHQKSVLGMEAEQKVMKMMGLDAEILDSGCCGMAGSFGYEHGDKYQVSVRAGERVLLPRVRLAPKETLILADGFSCREQIEQLSDRKALHLAEAIDMALREGSSGVSGSYPERVYAGSPAALKIQSAIGALALGGAVTGAVMLAGVLRRRS
jgi:Fe-S oxidoreductase